MGVDDRTLLESQRTCLAVLPQGTGQASHNKKHYAGTHRKTGYLTHWLVPDFPTVKGTLPKVVPGNSKPDHYPFPFLFPAKY
jgi:hypothetical protein